MTRRHRLLVTLAVSATCLSASAAKTEDAPFIEPAKPYVPELYDEQVLRRIEKARSDRNLSDELWLTLNTAAGTPQHFELWDNIAELSCREARTRARSANPPDRLLASLRREMGLAFAREFRCAVAVTKGERACYLPGPDERLSEFGLGAVPNPTVTPLCFQSLCGDGFRSGARHRRVAEIAHARHEARRMLVERAFPWVAQDAANIDQIEAYCASPH